MVVWVARVSRGCCGVGRGSGRCGRRARVRWVCPPSFSDGFGGEIGGIRFDEEFVFGDEFCGGLDVGGVFVGDDAGDADAGAEGEPAFAFGGGAGEAVDDEAEVGVILHDFEGVPAWASRMWRMTGRLSRRAISS